MNSPVLLLPGLGADPSLFLEQQKHFADRLITPQWITPEKKESLSSFCARFAESLMAQELAGCEALFLGGFSFGGMAALELASFLSERSRLKVRGVFLISSGRTQKILRQVFRLQAFLGASLPDFLLERVIKGQMLERFVHEEPLSAEQAACLKKMVESLDLYFFKWSLWACANWNPQDRFTGDNRSFPIFEIQGEDDKIIPHSEEEEVVTIKEAKHLIQYTHAKEINQWIEQNIQNG